MPNSLDAVSLAALCHEDVELPERSLRAVRWVPCASAQDACGLIRWSRVGERPQPAMCELDGARGWVCDGAACAAARHREPALSYLPPRPEGAHVSEVESHRLNISLWGTVAPVFSKNLCSWLTHRLHVACRARVPQSACPTEARALIRVRRYALLSAGHSLPAALGRSMPLGATDGLAAINGSGRDGCSGTTDDPDAKTVSSRGLRRCQLQTCIVVSLSAASQVATSPATAW